MGENGPEPNRVVSFMEMAREAERFGRQAKTAEQAFRTAPDEKIVLGAMLRTARALEDIGRVLAVAVEPLLAEAKRQRDQNWARHKEGWNAWLLLAEHKHGLCPTRVRQALREQFFAGRRDTPFELKYNAIYALDGRGLSSWWRPYPPCGPKSVTRREYTAWMKRRIRRTRKQEQKHA